MPFLSPGIVFHLSSSPSRQMPQDRSVLIPGLRTCLTGSLFRESASCCAGSQRFSTQDINDIIPPQLVHRIEHRRKHDNKHADHCDDHADPGDRKGGLIAGVHRAIDQPADRSRDRQAPEQRFQPIAQSSSGTHPDGTYRQTAARPAPAAAAQYSSRSC